jgi:hypothetical protein
MWVGRTVIFGTIASIGVVGCAAQTRTDIGNLTVRDVAPAASTARAGRLPQVLELKGVEIPDSAVGLRVFLVPKLGEKLELSSPYYVGSVAKGQVNKGAYDNGSSQTFVLEVDKVLLNLERSGVDIGRSKLKIVLQPIRANGLPTPGPARLTDAQIESTKQ